MKGYKIFNPDLTCRGFQYEIGKEYTHDGSFNVCSSGFHFCLKAQDCFSYYDFDPNNIVCEVEATGEIQTHSSDSKVATNKIIIVRQLSWEEVLKIANLGSGNSGHSNSGDSNSGNSNSGNWNSGDSNSGNSNSGDSNSGYRNSGAFCINNDPILYLFDKPSKMTVREWESHKAVSLMHGIENTFWVPFSHMSEEEKKNNPNAETCDGYLKVISLHEAWSNAWNNWSDENRMVFTGLENFDADIFYKITGIKI